MIYLLTYLLIFSHSYIYMPLYHICLQKGLFVDIISLRPIQSQYHTIPTTYLCTEYCVGKNVEVHFDLNTRINHTFCTLFTHQSKEQKGCRQELRTTHKINWAIWNKRHQTSLNIWISAKFLKSCLQFSRHCLISKSCGLQCAASRRSLEMERFRRLNHCVPECKHLEG